MIGYLTGLADISPGAFFPAVALGALPRTIGYITLRGALIARRLLRSQPAPATA
jgi:uncharacterized membrane protein YdjX (TVP38/TMEM64 family)